MVNTQVLAPKNSQIGQTLSPEEVIKTNRTDLDLLLEALPPIVERKIREAPDLDRLIEVVLDYGRPAEIRYMDRYERMLDYPVSEPDINYVCEHIGQFGGDNRAGIERTLHRISAIRSRQGRIIGLTCRVGRAILGTIDIVEDIVESSKSVLFLGKPGVGKTTKLREVARLLADGLGKRVVIVDTSNEIAGDGDIPHPAIGSARRMQVPDPASQHQVMIEAVENHMPEVIVIDEIGTEAETYAARTIAERGVQLVGTAHGRTLENLMMNPTLCDLIGGIQTVTLSDEEAKRRGTQKTVLERKAPPTFDVVIELLDYDRLAVHHDVQRTVDLILRGLQPRPEIRVRTSTGDVEVVQHQEEPAFTERMTTSARIKDPPKIPETIEQENIVASTFPVTRIFPLGIARTRLERVIREQGLSVTIANDLAEADAVLALRSAIQKKPNRFRDKLKRSIPTAAIKSSTLSQIAVGLNQLVAGEVVNDAPSDEIHNEVFVAIQTVKSKGKPVELKPQPWDVRKSQHRIIEQHRLRSESVGQEPTRRVRIIPR